MWLVLIFVVYIMFLLDSTGTESIYHQYDISAGFTFFGVNQSQIKNIQGKQNSRKFEKENLNLPYAVNYLEQLTQLTLQQH